MEEGDGEWDVELVVGGFALSTSEVFGEILVGDLHIDCCYNGYF